MAGETSIQPFIPGIRAKVMTTSSLAFFCRGAICLALPTDPSDSLKDFQNLQIRRYEFKSSLPWQKASWTEAVDGLVSKSQNDRGKSDRGFSCQIFIAMQLGCSRGCSSNSRQTGRLTCRSKQVQPGTQPVGTFNANPLSVLPPTPPTNSQQVALLQSLAFQGQIPFFPPPLLNRSFPLFSFIISICATLSTLEEECSSYR